MIESNCELSFGKHTSMKNLDEICVCYIEVVISEYAWQKKKKYKYMATISRWKRKHKLKYTANGIYFLLLEE